MEDLQRAKYSDPVRRIKDTIDLHATAKVRGWVVFALADGSPQDGNPVYPSWSDAVKSTKWNRDNFMYVQLQPDGIPWREAEAILKYARMIHDLGYRIPSPDWEHYEAAVMPRNRHDRRRAAKQLITGKPLLPDHVPYSNLPHVWKAE